MTEFIKPGRAFYGTGLIFYGSQQIFNGGFRSVFIPSWPSWPHEWLIFPYVTGCLLILAGAVIAVGFKIDERRLKAISLYIAAYFLILLIFCQLPLNLFISPYSPRHLGVWTDALKELAICGGALVMADSFDQGSSISDKDGRVVQVLSKLIPFGRIFFSITLISFGLDHVYYTTAVSVLIPNWMGFPEFWTYFGAIALICSGIAIILKILLRPIALLLATMLFIWVFIVHLPRAIADPYIGKGNEIASTFDALAFCGTALVIASVRKLNMQPGLSPKIG